MAGGHASLLILCAVWGFGAALVSLLISRWMAKRAMGVKLVDGRTGNSDLDWLHNRVGQLAQQANLPMPEVGYYDSPEVNAFATGPSKKRSLVAVSTGLLRQMDKREVEGVLAHEVSHIANGDMVTMTLIQGVVNAFVLYLSHIVAMIARNALSSRDERGPSFLGVLAGHMVFIAAQIAFGLLGSMIDAGEQPVRLDGPPEVRMGVFRRGEGEIVVHLHNTVGSRSKPASGKPVTLTAPASVRSAVLALSGKPLAVVRTGTGVAVEVPPVALHEVVLLK